MRQGAEEIESFIVKFVDEADRTDLNEPAKLVFLKRAVRLELYREMNRLIPTPETFMEWASKAIDVDRNMRRAEQEERMMPRQRPTIPQHAWNPWRPAQQSRAQAQPPRTSQSPMTHTSHPSQSQTQQPRPQLQHQYVPMDVDRQRAQQRQRPPMKCFKCGGFGHMARSCGSTMDLRLMAKEQVAELTSGGEESEKEVQDFPDAAP
jgi:hypothetical protein